MRERRLQEFLGQGEGTLELAASGCLKTDTARKLIEDKVVEARDWKEQHSMGANEGAVGEALSRVADRLNSFRAHDGTKRFPGVGMTETQVYREVFGVLTEVVSHPALAKGIIEAILDRIEEGLGSASVEPTLKKAR